MPTIPKVTLLGWVTRWASGLRFPWLLALVALVFLVDLFVPDLVPFADEIVLGLVTVVLSGLRKRRTGESGGAEADRPESPEA